MGTWGLGSFENDNAADWVWELEESQDFGVVHEALAAVLAGDEGLVAPSCEEAIAAAEVVAACLGRPVADLPEEVEAWVRDHRAVPEGMLDLATRAVARIEAESELRDLWKETEHWDSWRAVMQNLVARLAA